MYEYQFLKSRKPAHAQRPETLRRRNLGKPKRGSGPLLTTPQEPERASGAGRSYPAPVQCHGTRHLHPSPPPRAGFRLGTDGGGAGAFSVLRFDEEGRVLARADLNAGDGDCAVEIPAHAWHSVVSRALGTIMFEIKPGPYWPIEDQDFAPWAPPEDDPRAPGWVRWFETAKPGDRAPAWATMDRAANLGPDDAVFPPWNQRRRSGWTGFRATRECRRAGATRKAGTGHNECSPSPRPAPC